MFRIRAPFVCWAEDEPEVECKLLFASSWKQSFSRCNVRAEENKEIVSRVVLRDMIFLYL